jgi:hypothetical protein
LDGGLVLAPEDKMKRVTSGKMHVLAKELESLGIRVLILKSNSQYHVTLVVGDSSVTFSGIALQVERLVKAFKLGYEWGWKSRRNYEAARSSCVNAD